MPMIDMQKMLDAFKAGMRQQRSEYHLTLGKLIAGLDAAPDNCDVVFDYVEYSPGDPHSYRGYYSDLAFELVETKTTVKEFLALCINECIDATFEGYKGGDFTMGADTPLWLSEYGTSAGRAIIGMHVSDDNKRVVLETKELSE